MEEALEGSWQKEPHPSETEGRPDFGRLFQFPGTSIRLEYTRDGFSSAGLAPVGKSSFYPIETNTTGPAGAH